MVQALLRRLYYRLMRILTGVPIIDNAADFGLISRFAVGILNDLPEKKVYRLLRPSLGFSNATVAYRAEQRRGGKSKYGLRRPISLTLRSSIQFSPDTLRLVALAGLVTSLLAAIWLGFVLVSFLIGHALSGRPSLMPVTFVLGEIILFSPRVLGQ